MQMEGRLTDIELTDAVLRRAIDAAPDGIVVVGADGVVRFANPTLLEMFGYSADELLGATIETLLPESLRDGHVERRSTYVDQPRTRPMGSGLDLRGRRKSGEEFPVEIGLSPVSTPSGPLVIAVVRDVTERRMAADELARMNEQLALVDDRERIARDLHDTVIQRLFAVGLSLQGAATRAGSPDVAERIETAIEEIDATIREIRTAIFTLHARRAPTAGPRDDVLAIAREASRALGFEPQVTFEGLVDTAMPPTVRDELVPTLREALSNVAKHAHASRVGISVSVADDKVALVVRDNGVGIGGDAGGGNGLGNMAERAIALGGACTVRRGTAGGTVVEWRVPLERSARGE
jgi:PAS domain S-box-containing protein